MALTRKPYKTFSYCLLGTIDVYSCFCVTSHTCIITFKDYRYCCGMPNEFWFQNAKTVTGYLHGRETKSSNWLNFSNLPFLLSLWQVLNTPKSYFQCLSHTNQTILFALPFTGLPLSVFFPNSRGWCFYDVLWIHRRICIKRGSGHRIFDILW